jgi:malate dehydrogenase
MAASECPAGKAPLKVLVTGTAGQIGYSLVPLIARGDMFGPKQPIDLVMLDIEPAQTSLGGLKMELEDGAYPLLTKVTATASEEEAFKDLDAAILVGAMPRKEGMERKDLLRANIKIFRSQGKALDKFAKKTVKVLVVGNPANTNCLIARKYAPSLPDTAFSCLTRLDHNRGTSQVALKLKLSPCQVEGVIIWGNHSATQFPDLAHATVTIGGTKQDAIKALNDDNWVQNDFITTVQKRGAAIIAARKLSSALSAAKAISDHMHDWFLGSSQKWVSMGVVSDGSYGISKGLVYSYPVKTGHSHSAHGGHGHDHGHDHGATYEIVQGLSISDFAKGKMQATEKELLEERDIAEGICAEEDK